MLSQSFLLLRFEPRRAPGWIQSSAKWNAAARARATHLPANMNKGAFETWNNLRMNSATSSGAPRYATSVKDYKILAMSPLVAKLAKRAAFNNEALRMARQVWKGSPSQSGRLDAANPVETPPPKLVYCNVPHRGARYEYEEQRTPMQEANKILNTVRGAPGVQKAFNNAFRRLYSEPTAQARRQPLWPAPRSQSKRADHQRVWDLSLKGGGSLMDATAAQVSSHVTALNKALASSDPRIFSRVASRHNARQLDAAGRLETSVEAIREAMETAKRNFDRFSGLSDDGSTQEGVFSNVSVAEEDVSDVLHPPPLYRAGAIPELGGGDATEIFPWEEEEDRLLQMQETGKVVTFSPHEDVRKNKTFAALGVPQHMREILAVRGIQHPSGVQFYTIPILLKGVDTFFAAPTGTGKTLTYGIPLVMRIAELKKLPLFRSRPGHPLAVVLVPSPGLMGQAYGVLKVIGDTVGLSVSTYCDVMSRSDVAALSSVDIDVLVTTPKSYSRLLWMNRNSDIDSSGISLPLDDCRAMVVDEADIMLAPGSMRYTFDVLDRALETMIPEAERLPDDAVSVDPASRHHWNTRLLAVTRRKASADSIPAPGVLLRPLQVVYCMATPNNAVRSVFKHRCPSGVILEDADVFKPRKNLKQEFIYCKQVEKLTLLLHLLDSAGHKCIDPTVSRPDLWENVDQSDNEAPEFGATLSNHFKEATAPANKPSGKKILIFANSSRRAFATATSLRARGVNVFLVCETLAPSLRTQSLHRFKSEQSAVLVTTDILARGVDDLGCDFVILYDFPWDAGTYLHRIGRVARARDLGFATSLVVPKSRLLAEEIQRNMQADVRLEQINTALVQWRAKNHNMPWVTTISRRQAVHDAGGISVRTPVPLVLDPVNVAKRAQVSVIRQRDLLRAQAQRNITSASTLHRFAKRKTHV